VLTDWLLAPVGLALIVAAAYAGAELATRLGQPRIAGQLIGVVFVGPTVLGGQIDGVVEGATASGAAGALFPAASVGVLAVVGSIGLILYMLLVGLTIQPRPMLRRAGTIALLTVTVSAGTAVVALVAAPWLREDGGWQGPSADGSAFALALAAALIANGVPVVARILEERGLLETELGAITISSAACITTLALVVAGVAVKGGDLGAAERLLLILAAAAALVAAATAIARSRTLPLAAPVAIALLLGLALAAGIAGRSLVGTALVGPLVVGICAPGTSAAAAFVQERLGRLVRDVLLPVFLGFAALHTNLRELGPDVLAPVAAILVAVTAVKLAAAYTTGRATGFARGDAGALAAMLQCGGIMTIAISLTVLDAGLITTRLHAALTLAGLLTTVAAGPLLRLARGRPRTG
jgi:Kef-type K+ transport system membrane component KefB